MSLETKADIDGAAPATEVKAAMREFLGVFENFKDENDARLAALESKKSEDVLVTEKLGRLNQALSEQKAAIERLSLAAKRPARGAAATPVDEKKSAFLRYMRAGDASALHALEEKAAIAGVDSEGGYLAPDETERLISAALKEISPIRAIASVREIGGNVFRKPVSKGETAAGWVGETAARPETAASTLAAIDFPTMELYAIPAASQALLDDGVVDVEQWLADEVQTEFAQQEGEAFVKGDGVNKPKGFLSYTTVAESVRAFGEIGHVATGAAGAFAADPGDQLLDLVHATKQVYRANGRFVMNRGTVGALRKLKDNDGNYLWRPSLEAGQPATLLGYPVTEAEDMPAIAANALSIAFGDFARGYLVVDRVGVRILRDPYSAKPYVLFYTTKRVGGGVQNFDAIKLLKFAAS